ncbi:MAG: ribosome-binding factor A, partial [Alphaproteobacteria bacterium]|nr:ribosome-binding factor A [Alphaproteobacteria bacterium]
LAQIWPTLDHVLSPEAMRITLSEVQISPDLKNATIFYMTPRDVNALEIKHLLHDRIKMIRYELAQHLTLKFSPRLIFKEDTVEDIADRIQQLLKESGDV